MWEREEKKHHPSAGEHAIRLTLTSELVHPLLSSPAVAQEKSTQTYFETNWEIELHLETRQSKKQLLS